MKVNNVLNHLNHIEATFPVKHWKLEGIDVWPIIRLKLYFYLTRLDLNLPEDISTGSVRKKYLLIIKNHIKYFFLLLNPSARKNAIQADALFLADPSYVELSNKLYQRFCDPVIEEIAKKGISEFTLTLLKDLQKPLETPAFFTALSQELIFDWAKIRQKLGLNSFKLSSLAGWDDFIAYILKIQDISQPLSLEIIESDLFVFKDLIRYYRKILKAVKPKCAFVVSYYDNGLNNMAYIYACKTMSIPTIDLQHGTINDLHAAYGRWTHLPSIGYNTLPDYFACWDKASADCINSWASKYKGHHKALVFGNRFMQVIASEKSSAFKCYFKKMELQYQPEKNILLTLQVECGFPNLLKEALLFSPRSYFWWIRFHPMMTDAEKLVAINIISEIKDLNYNIDEVSDAILYSVLPHIDIHVTLNSSVVQEALQFGVPSIVCDQTGYEYYKKEIESGIAYEARDLDDILKFLACINPQRQMPEYIPSNSFYKEIGLL